MSHSFLRIVMMAITLPVLTNWLIGVGWSQLPEPAPAQLSKSSQEPAAGSQDDSGESQLSKNLYAAMVAADQPAFYWSFDQGTLKDVSGKDDSGQWVFKQQGNVKSKVAGPRGEKYPLFSSDNEALEFGNKAGYLTLDDSPIKTKDPAAIAASPLRFQQGDSITLEAWADVQQIADNQQMYVVGKGRTKRSGYPAENQNYALRLAGKNGQALVSFLFRDADSQPGISENYHRWNSQSGVAVDSGWHHIAVSYTFGEPKSIKGYIDGTPVEGTWDYGGPTTKAPVVDDDQLWVGSSLGGNPSSTFRGLIDEVAIYRSALSPDRIAQHARIVQEPPYLTPREHLSRDNVFVEIFHHVPDKHNWEFRLGKPFESFQQVDWSLIAIPQLYNSHGVRADRSNPVVVRLSGLVVFSPETRHLLLRARSGARLWIDDQLVLDNRHPGRGSDGHGPLYRVESRVSDAIRPLQPGDYEQAIAWSPTPGEHRVQVDLWVGGKGRRPELGEMCLASSADGKQFHVMSVRQPFRLDDWHWEQWAKTEKKRLESEDTIRRRKASEAYARYWEKRHQLAKDTLGQQSQGPIGEVLSRTKATVAAINREIQQGLSSAGVEPMAPISDAEFLRKSTLDILGTIPSLKLQEHFWSLAESNRRAQWIDWLLEQPGWADHWVAYWQDVLAENPNLVNPTLNNTGPFRYWIHESFSDNKPFDRFATELILMEGSTYFGGPAGFALATQNDSPMAAKAHILAQAFLGMEMKCARCHDAPYHDFQQRDLFSLAAMLKREPESVPKTSTIPGDENALKSLLVKVTLKPGEPVPPEWPFAERLSASLSPDILEHPADRREQLAVLVTSPANRRFADVIVNRLWQRYLGKGIVEPIDDWENPDPTHPQVLSILEQELIASGYDLKQIARVILNTEVYQRKSDQSVYSDARRARLFAGPAPRKLTAEQLVDSLFVASGKSFRTEELNIDVDGLRPMNQSLGFGFPERAWEFVATNNERDRPSLALPGVQSFINVLETFGWRASRPDPQSLRSQETTVLQPATLANGTLTLRASQLSDDSLITELAISSKSVEEFVEKVFQQLMTRAPSVQEKAMFVEFLSSGFSERLLAGTEPRVVLRPQATGVSWTNHLQSEANSIKVNYAMTIEKGDEPSSRLQADWRERAEDFVWTLINMPEFVLRN